MVVSLGQDEVAYFKAMFNPLEVKSYCASIKLFIVDNPFENISFKLMGEVFYEEVMIEKIRTAFPFLSEDTKEIELDFRFIFYPINFT